MRLSSATRRAALAPMLFACVLGIVLAMPSHALAEDVVATTNDTQTTAQGGGFAAITLTARTSGDPIEGVTFEFTYVDSVSDAITGLGEVTTDSTGLAGLTVTREGRYFAKYVRGLDTTKYSDAELKSLKYEMTITSSDDSGVQLVQDWQLQQANIRYRDIITSGDSVLACGGIDGDAVIYIPGDETYDGKEIALDPADGKGVIVKVDTSTGKILWVSQFDNDRSYSMVDMGDGTTALVDYKAASGALGPKVHLFDADGNETGSFVVPAPWREFDINKTSDGCIVVVADDNRVYKYDLAGNKQYISGSLETSGASPAKSIVQTGDGDFLVAGGGETANSYVGKYGVADDGAVTKRWVFNMSAANARFNDAIETTEDGSLFYIAVGDITTAEGTNSYTIPGSQTSSGDAITIDTNANGAKTAVIVKLNAKGKVVFAQSFFGSDATSHTEQEFDSVATATDGAGGYVVAGKAAGTVTIKAENSILGETETVHASDISAADSAIVRWSSDGKYIDSYLYGTDTADDEYYAVASADGKVWATGNDSFAGIVQLSSTLTAIPRSITVAEANSFKVTCSVDADTGGTISGQGWVYYEECLDGAHTTKAITATPDAGHYLWKIEVNGKVVAMPFSTDAYTLSPLLMDEDKDVVAFFVEGDVPSFVASFESNGGSAVDPQTITAGDTITEPATPTRDGYAFAGWYADKRLTRAWDFSTAVTADVTLYASWTADPTTPDEPTTPDVPTTPSEPSDVIPTDGGTITPQTSDPTSSAAAVLVALAGSAIAIGMIGRRREA